MCQHTPAEMSVLTHAGIRTTAVRESLSCVAYQALILSNSTIYMRDNASWGVRGFLVTIMSKNPSIVWFLPSSRGTRWEVGTLPCGIIWAPYVTFEVSHLGCVVRMSHCIVTHWWGPQRGKHRFFTTNSRRTLHRLS